MIPIFDLDSPEPQTPKPWHYALLFIGTHIVLALLLQIGFSLVGRSPSGSMAFVPSVIIVSCFFMMKYKRVMTRPERVATIIYSLLFSLLLIAPAFNYYAYTNDLTLPFHWTTIIAAVLAVMLMMYVLMNLIYGWISEKFLLKYILDSEEEEKEEPKED